MSKKEMSGTPSLGEVIEHAILSTLSEAVHTSLPASIETYDPATRKASVKPLIKRVYAGKAVDLPVIVGVPVIFPTAGKFYINFPVEKGDTVLLLFAERELDGFLSSGANSEPESRRQFSLSDAVAVLGLCPFSKPNAAKDTTAAEIGFDKCLITMTAGNDVFLSNEAGKFELSASGKISLNGDALTVDA